MGTRFISEGSSTTHFDFKDVIGAGGFATVTLVHHRNGNFDCVLKRVDISAKTNKLVTQFMKRNPKLTENEAIKKAKETIGRMKHEHELLKKLKHKFIVQVFGYFEEDEMGSGLYQTCKFTYWYLAEEYCAGGCLMKAIINQRENHRHFSERQIRIWSDQLVSAINHLHSKEYVHRDINPNNVFLTAEKDVRLGDFGLAECINDRPLYTGLGTELWSSPEFLRGKRYQMECDIFSAGATIAHALNLEPLFQSPEHIRENSREELCSKYHQLAHDFVNSMLRSEPTERWTIKKLINHPFLRAHSPSNIEFPFITTKVLNGAAYQPPLSSLSDIKCGLNSAVAIADIEISGSSVQNVAKEPNANERQFVSGVLEPNVADVGDRDALVAHRLPSAPNLDDARDRDAFVAHMLPSAPNVDDAGDLDAFMKVVSQRIPHIYEFKPDDLTKLLDSLHAESRRRGGDGSLYEKIRNPILDRIRLIQELKQSSRKIVMDEIVSEYFPTQFIVLVLAAFVLAIAIYASSLSFTHNP